MSNVPIHSPGTADIHWKEGIWQGDFRWISVIYKLVSKEDVIVYTVSKEHCETNHKQQLTAHSEREREREKVTGGERKKQ